jgi:hypothetical protein
MGEPGFRRENVSELEYPEANIPPSAWTSAGLRWPDLILKTPDGQYFEMAVSTEALFREFPQPASSVEGGQVERRGSLLFMSAEDGFDNLRKRGRPRLGVRDAMAVEIAMIANGLDGLPEKQADLERALLKWCSDRGEHPGEATIRRIVKPYYVPLRARQKPRN